MSPTNKSESVHQKRREEGRTPFSLWLSEDERAALEAVAKKERRSMADQVRHLIALADPEKEAA